MEGGGRGDGLAGGEENQKKKQKKRHTDRPQILNAIMVRRRNLNLAIGVRGRRLVDKDGLGNRPHVRLGPQQGGRDLVAGGEVGGDANVRPARARRAGELVLQVVRLKGGRLEEDAHAVVLAQVERREPAGGLDGGRRLGALRPVGDVLVVGR